MVHLVSNGCTISSSHLFCHVSYAVAVLSYTFSRPIQLHVPGRPNEGHRVAWCRCASAVLDQLTGRPRRVPQVQGGGSTGNRQGRAPPMVQCLPLLRPAGTWNEADQSYCLVIHKSSSDRDALHSSYLNHLVSCRYQARRLEMTTGERFQPDPVSASSSTNVMDAWIQATLQGLVQVNT